jgi:hypothetical protein
MNDNDTECSNVNCLFLHFMIEKHERLNCEVSDDKNAME